MKKMLLSALAALAVTPVVAMANEPMVAYLFSYFTGNTPAQEQICYAVSYDGFNYMPLNSGDPVIASSEIAKTGSVRDPHILRGYGDDPYFYMVATDMKSENGWQSNHGLVLMRSTDLVNWENHAIDFVDHYPGTKFANAKYVWAPQTIYDETVGKYMLYFAFGDGDKVAYQTAYYVYANEDFSDLEKDASGKYVEPQVLFDRGAAAIDMDIVLDDAGIYHCFYKDEATTHGVTQCTFNKADLHNYEKWNFNYPRLSYNEAAEGCGAFQLRNGDWCLMWDCYANGHYCFTRSADLNTFKTAQYTTTSGKFTPRHGTVIAITQRELDALKKAYPYTATSEDGKRISDMRKMVNGTNFISPEAYSDYLHAVECLEADYAANTLPAAVGAVYGAWRGETSTPCYLMSAFGGVKEGDDYWNGLHINTWSTEGNTDGSDFVVPFYEYWCDQSGHLPDAAFAAMIPVEDASKLYKVTAKVRVQLTSADKNGSGRGIAMQVGDGAPVNICTGADYNNGFRLDTYTAYGYADATGNLRLTFDIAGTNCNWLAFKDVFYQVENDESLYAEADPVSVSNPKDMTKWMGAWRNGTGACNFSYSSNPQGEGEGEYFESWNWDALIGKTFTQTIDGVPDGYYLLRMAQHCNVASVAYAYCGEGKSFFNPENDFGHYTFALGKSIDNQIEVGVKHDTADGQWNALNDWSLLYLGRELSLTDNVDFADGLAGWLPVGNCASGCYEYGQSDALNGISSPAAPEGSNGKCLGLVASDHGTALYVSPMSLEKGEYTVKARIYAAQGDAEVLKNIVGAVMSDGSEAYCTDAKVYAAGSWIDYEATLVVDQCTEGCLTLGYIANAGEIAKNPHLFIDRVAVSKGASEGIESVAADQLLDDILYNLQGIPVSHPTPGIYIQGGRKILIR